MRYSAVIGLILLPFYGVLGQSDNQKKEVDQLLDQSFSYTQSNADSAILLSQKAIHLAKEYGYEYGVADGQTKLAIAYRFKGLYDTSIYLSTEALDITENNFLKASSYNNLGVCYRYKGNYEKALSFYLKAADVYQKDNDLEQLGIVYNNIGTMFLFSEFIGKAKKYLQKSLSIHLENNHQKPLADVYNNFGIYYANMGDLQLSLSYFNRSMKIEKELGNIRGVNDSYFNIASVYTMMGNLDSAIVMIQKSVQLDKDMGNIQGVISDYNALAEVLFEFDENEKAFAYLDSAINYAKAIGSQYELASAYKNQATAYADNNEYQKAYRSSLNFQSTRDSAMAFEQRKAIAELETQYATKEKQRQIELQHLEIKNKEAKIYQSRLQIVGLIILIAGILIIGTLLYFYYKTRKEKELKNAIIKEKELGLESIIQATEEERKRIAKDLHDGIGQQLSGLKMAIRNIKDSLDFDETLQQKQFEKISSIIDESAANVRSISHEMMPKVLMESGLVAAIADMLSKSLAVADIPYEYDHFDEQIRLPETVEITLFRIAQELINNIIKHANATQVNLQLYKTSKFIILVVEDDGKGVEIKENDGHGMTNIKSRAHNINGEFIIEKGLHKGTIATVKIPIKEKNNRK